jgi:predicted MFS family arabinose efflux permease
MAVLSERKLVLLIGSIQFVNVLDFMMVMPLGPDFARDLGIPSSQLGLIGGSYTAAAAIAGIAGAFFLDRFDRRRALAVALAGLVLGTVAGGFATGLPSLLGTRILAGAFGGPATALALAIVSDAVPAERRGRAMGAVMAAFSVASVIGVPAGLELARVGSWRTPFFVVAALGAVIAIAAMALLPPQTAHLAHRRSQTPFRVVLARPVVLLALTSVTVAVIANFALIPNISAYLQFNLHYPRDQLGILYLVGGALSFGTMRLAGYLTDRYDPATVAAGGSAAFIAIMLVGFIYPVLWIPVMFIFVGFMISGSFRFVPMQTLTSRVPLPAERARFMSAQSAVQHLASSAGAMIGAQVLTEAPGGALVGMDRLAWFAVVMAVALPIVLAMVNRRLQPVLPVAQVVPSPAR